MVTLNRKIKERKNGKNHTQKKNHEEKKKKNT